MPPRRGPAPRCSRSSRSAQGLSPRRSSHRRGKRKPNLAGGLRECSSTRPSSTQRLRTPAICRPAAGRSTRRSSRSTLRSRLQTSSLPSRWDSTKSPRARRRSRPCIVSHAHSDIRCGRAEPSPKDFVTGGGFIDIAGGKANFGFVAGFKPHATAPSCQFTYIDHDAGIRVKMTDITDYGGSGTTRTFKGTAMVNGALDTATITVYDGGEPGRGVDTFRISLDSGYVADGTLAGGNIQLHA